MTDWVDNVLHFWFVTLSRKQWFGGGPALDEEIRARFTAVLHEVAALHDDALTADARTALAAVVVLDQFPRQIYRGHAQAFAYDAKALSIARTAVAKGFSAGLTLDQKLFLCLPYEHCEDLATQEESVALISELGDPEYTKYAIAHRDIILRFGRFPHRNAILGRSASAEEIEFLKQPGSSF